MYPIHATQCRVVSCRILGHGAKYATRCPFPYLNCEHRSNTRFFKWNTSRVWQMLPLRTTVIALIQYVKTAEIHGTPSFLTAIHQLQLPLFQGQVKPSLYIVFMSMVSPNSWWQSTTATSLRCKPQIEANTTLALKLSWGTNIYFVASPS